MISASLEGRSCSSFDRIPSLQEATVLRAIVGLHEEHFCVSLLHELHWDVRIVDSHPADKVSALVDANNFDLDLQYKVGSFEHHNGGNKITIAILLEI